MAVIHRRTFHGKVGAADQLVAHLKTWDQNFKKFGFSYTARILTDHISGRTDRVVWEWEVPSIGKLESDMQRAMADPKAQPEFARWFAKLTSLINHAEVEHLMVQ